MHKEEEVEKLLKAEGFKLLEKKEFPLEIKYEATLFVYEKN